MIRAVIFDCFGVLVGRGFWHMYQDAGGDIVRDIDFINGWLNQLSLGTTTSEAMDEAMAGKLGISIANWREHLSHDEAPNADVFHFIESKLHGHYKLAVLSNANRGVLERKIPGNLLGLFDERIVSAEVGLIKPDPAIFRLVLERLRVAPHEAVFTDDHQAYLAGADEIGMHTILYKDLAYFQQELAGLLS